MKKYRTPKIEFIEFLNQEVVMNLVASSNDFDPMPDVPQPQPQPQPGSQHGQDNNANV